MAIYLSAVNANEADPAQQGGEWLHNFIQREQGDEAARAFSSKFKALLPSDDAAETKKKGKYKYGPAFDLFVECCSELFGAAVPEGRGDAHTKEVESFFALIFSMLGQLTETDHVDRATAKLCKTLTASSQQQPDLRLRLLMMLYNTFPPSVEHRSQLFKYILDYAAEAKLFDQVMPYLEYLDAWMEDWKAHIKTDWKRELFCDISRYLRAQGKRVDSFLYLKRYHQLYQGEGDACKAQKVQDATLELLKDAVQIPSVIQFDDILAYDTVKALAATKHKDLFQLAEVFYLGTVNTLRDFTQKHPKVFDEYGLDLQEATGKIRLLTLATLAQSRSEMTLAEIARELEESEENIERWVVRAISEGVIDGRIDQLNHKVLVKSAFQRKFEKEEWTFLDSKLSQWIDNLENVISHIAQHKATKEAIAQAAAAS